MADLCAPAGQPDEKFATATHEDIRAGAFAAAAARLQALPAPETWRHPGALLEAARLVGWLGAGQRRERLIQRAWRLSRGADGMAHCARLRQLRSLRGPFAAFEFARDRPLAATASPRARAGWWSALGAIVASFHDVERANEYWQRAREVGAEPEWLLVERSSALQDLDRLEEAAECAAEARALAPHYASALLADAHLRLLRGRDDETVDLAGQFLADCPCAMISDFRAAVLLELGRLPECLEETDRLERLAVFAEPAQIDRRRGLRVRAHYLLGNWEAAAAEASESTHARELEFAARLRSAPPAAGARMTLPVAFVRQDNRTCGPATLAAVMRFLGRNVAQEEITKEIWNDGTRDVDERGWAERSGCAVREFRLDRASAQTLLAAGIPFALATRAATSGHLQAVIGFDAFKDAFILRDSNERSMGDVDATELLNGQASNGPRALAFVPLEDTARVAALRGAALPEADEYDLLHRIHLALRRFDRDEAARLLATLPPGRLQLEARRDLARYDGNELEQLEVVNALLERFPGAGALQVERIALLDSLARLPEADAAADVLAAESWTSTTDRGAVVFAWTRRTRRLSEDGRQSEAARRSLRLALRRAGTDESLLGIAAGQLWDERRRAEAAEVYRLAACLRGGVEGWWRTLFQVLRVLGRDGELLGLLRERLTRLGAVSSDPACTLAWVHRERHEYAASDAVLAEALARRPEDGALRLHVAELRLGEGARAEAARLLEEARGRTGETDWLRTAALAADQLGNPPAALVHWRALVVRRPLSEEAHGAVARLLAETAGPAAALAHLDTTVAGAPHALPLQTLRCAWHTQHGTLQSREQAVRDMLGVFPSSAWAWRELALALLDTHRGEEALEAADRALAIDPAAAGSNGIRAQVLSVLGRTADAAAAARIALELHPDHRGIIGLLVNLATDAEATRAALEWALGRLKSESREGSGVLEWRDAALGRMEPARIAALLQDLHAARPDLWSAWIALAAQQRALEAPEEAARLLRLAVDRFDRLPRMWVELSEVEAELGQAEASEAACRRAILLNPFYGWASRFLARLLSHRGDVAGAREVIATAITHAPLDVFNYIVRAEQEWAENAASRALDTLEHALRLEPGAQRAWELHGEYARRSGDPSRVVRCARALTEARAGEPRSWMVLAEVLMGTSEFPAALAALERAIALNPRAENAHDLKATMLAQAGRFSEAFAATTPDAWPEAARPLVLRGRAAWIRAMRGDYDGAREAMRALVASEPSYRWGWERIAEWSERLNDQEGSLAAAEQLARLEGNEAVALAYRADARLAKGQREAAKEDLREAWRILPSYSWAALRLLGIELEDGEVEAARQLRTRISERFGETDERTQRAELELAVHSRDQAAAGRAFVGVLDAAREDDRVVWLARERYCSAFSGQQLARVVFARLHLPKAPPAAAEIWAKESFQPWGWLSALWRLRRLPREVREPALIQAANALAESGAIFGVLALAQFFGAREARGSDAVWGAFTFAFARSGWWRRGARWSADWRARPGAESWMLSNVALMFRMRGRVQEADEAVRRAFPVRLDAGLPTLFYWRAFECALRGEFDEARAHLAEGERRERDPDVDRLIAHCTRELLAAASGEPGAIQNAWNRLVPKLSSSVQPVPPFDESLGCWRALCHLARKRGFFARIQAWFQRPLTTAEQFVRIVACVVVAFGAIAIWIHFLAK